MKHEIDFDQTVQPNYRGTYTFIDTRWVVNLSKNVSGCWAYFISERPARKAFIAVPHTGLTDFEAAKALAKSALEKHLAV